jgi:hypothetical protein
MCVASLSDKENVDRCENRAPEFGHPMHRRQILDASSDGNCILKPARRRVSLMLRVGRHVSTDAHQRLEHNQRALSRSSGYHVATELVPDPAMIITTGKILPEATVTGSGKDVPLAEALEQLVAP